MALSASPIVHTSQYNFNVTMNAGGSWACTIVWMKSTGSTSSEIVTTNGNRSTPTGAARMIFIVNGSPTVSGTFTVTQGAATLHTCSFTNEVTITFDVT